MEVEYPAQFDEFWSRYPHKRNKIDARHAWNRAVTKAAPQVILQGLVDYYKLHFNPYEQVQVQPSTWLNQERWRWGDRYKGEIADV